uniref:myosin light chain kinase 2, skeletal/cardiac muscle-like isoform X4 n=1 Tax=Gasterosteus aculeatus aculeatus TaxID=481459 RepID=UPI001A99E95A|nr:myosin light chain kinase 2, skeletal/cardiac muscle-like isoform X4 [Gasterosteus aculeatus aculeatus]
MSSLVMNTVGDGNGASIDLIQNRIESLSSKMDKLINIQEKVLNRLDGMSQDIDGIEMDMENLKVDKEEIHIPPKMVSQTQVMGREVREICQEMSTIMLVVNQRSEQQAQKLEGMEKLVLSMQQVISFIGETVKSSRVMELIFKGSAARKGGKSKESKGKQAIKGKSSTDTIHKKLDKLKDHKGRDGIDKPPMSPEGLKAEKKMKPPDTAESISLKKQILLFEEVQKLNRENAEKSGHQLTGGNLDLEAASSPEDQQPDAPDRNLVDGLQKDPQAAVDDEHKVVEAVAEDGFGEKVNEAEGTEKEPKLHVEEVEEEKKEDAPSEEVTEAPQLPATSSDDCKDALSSPEVEQVQISEVCTLSSSFSVTEELFVVEEHTKSLVVVEAEEEAEAEAEEKTKVDNEADEQKLESEGWAVFRADGIQFQLNLKQRVERERKEKDAEEEEGGEVERYFIDTSSPPAAPFNHRIVSAKPNQIVNFYTINWQEVLGGGRFGQVHKCVENSSGLTLAAKVIKARSMKEKEVVKNEIQVMNNLDHASLIQLYAAYESRNDIILVLEYVGGGELFDRIIDENYTLMELDAVLFIRQICEGLQHMHKMYILHLDLKPENILCVSRVTNKIKIIDFGLARIYKPREKLRVNFGTPEFLAPEVINYDFVSFNTDMWSLGVITYMLLSGLCPFLGDDDNETLNNILACKWNFEEQEFTDTSEEAKDFISRLLIVNKSWRIGASEALRHPWLCSPVLHHRLHTKKTMCRSRRSSCVATTDS